MKNLVIGLIPAGFITAVWGTILGGHNSICNYNIKHLEWMENHIDKFDPPATPDERESLYIELFKQRQYKNTFIAFRIWSPSVDWTFLPMDDAYIDFIKNIQ